ncbi:unnamed protein product [Cuscuta europaea]|uniref:Uncharacterized protein n=1 Tax=Cuscuta europaea TaxID=41803 RepID=A0A9P0YJJ6_CUSEU|nr:unnamed protein product [Cuscuta europaea]
MGVQLPDVAVEMRKVLIFSIKTCYKIVSSHPFLVGLLCFLALLYRSFPLVFSVLVSVSPVLICTAILLGTLLNFGNPNIPEVEKEEEGKTIHDHIVSLKTGVLSNSTVLEKDESYYSVEQFKENKNILDQLLDDPCCGKVENQTRGIELYDGNISEHKYSPIPNMDDESLDSDYEKPSYSCDNNMDEHNLDFDKKSADSCDSKMVNIGSPLIDREDFEHHQYSPVHNIDDDRNLKFDEKDSKVAMVDSKQEEQEEDADYDDETSDSGSDGAESSSPDASLADIIPILDELHPLLDEDENNPQPVNDSDSESDDGYENQEVEEKIRKEQAEIKSRMIIWTEEDEKNLMDLGSSEIERNQRLESLIARRRARMNRRSTMVEKNLIDFESVCDLIPFNISPISIPKKNPFDLAADDIGLPPIPGSAPSVMLSRSNPFDIPYDSSEEKPDLMEDSFQQEFKTAKDPFFSVRPSLFVPIIQDKRSEGASYPRFQRQPSELSESKVSSIPETESNDSAIDSEVQNLADETDGMSWKSEENGLEVGPSPAVPAHEGCASAEALDLIATEIHSQPETSIGGADVDENHQYREPMYDLSPTGVEKRSSSSIASDDQVKEIKEMEKSTPISEEILANTCSQPNSPGYKCAAAAMSFLQSDDELRLVDSKDQTEVQETPLMLMESPKKASDSNVLEMRDVDGEAHSPPSHAFNQMLHTGDDGQTDTKESSVNELENGDHIDVLSPHKFFMEAIDFHGNMQHVDDETDDIKEIDERILSELDAVGDFSFNEPVSTSFSNEFESLSVLHNIGSVSPRFLEEKEIEEKEDSNFVHEKSFPVLGPSLLNQNSSTEDVNLGATLVEEASSLKDPESSYENKGVLELSELPQENEKCDPLDHHFHIDSPFEQIDHEERERPDLLDQSTHSDIDNEKAPVNSGSPRNVILHEHVTLIHNEIPCSQDRLANKVELDTEGNLSEEISYDVPEKLDCEVNSKDSNFITSVEKVDQEAPKHDDSS